MALLRALRRPRRVGMLAPLLGVLACQGQAVPLSPLGPALGVALQPPAEVEAERAERRWPGPVPDFAPMAAIVTHHTLVDLAPEFPELLTQVLGERHVVAMHSAPDPDPDPDADEEAGLDDSMVWMRDYQPLYVRHATGRLDTLHYLSGNPNRTRFRIQRHPELPAGMGPRVVPALMRLDALRHEQAHGRPDILPILHENGNLVTSGALIFVTDRLLEDNEQPAEKDHLEALGYRARRREEVLQLVAAAFGRPAEGVVIMPQMPYEATGHVDLYLLPLGPRLVMVPSINPSDLGRVADPMRRSIGDDVRRFLDAQAAFLEGLHLEVLRMPMIPPGLAFDEGVQDIDRWQQDFDLLVYSPANALLADVGGEKHVFVPALAAAEEEPALSTLAEGYTERWLATFRRLGWTPHRVAAEGLVSSLGLLRCVTASIPE